MYNCRCGNRFTLEVFTSVDMTERSDLLDTLLEGHLNRGACNACGAAVAVETKCVLHDPDRRRLLLYIPDKERHAELEARAELLNALARDPAGGLPSYVLNFEVVFGPEGLREALARDPGSLVSPELEAREKELEERAKELEAKGARLAEWEARLDQREKDLEARSNEVEELAMRQSAFRIDRAEPGEGRFAKEAASKPGAVWVAGKGQAPTPLEESIHQALPDFDDELEETAERRDGEGISVSDEDVLEEAEIIDEESIVEEKSLEDEAAREAPPTHPEPTVPAADMAEAPSTKAAKKPGRVDDEVLEALEKPGNRHVRLVDDSVDLFTLTNDESLLDAVKRSSVRFRVHMIEDGGGYPWVLLSAAVRPPGREIHLFNWLLDYQVRVQRRVLGRLGERCEAHVTLVSPGMERNVTFVARNRIEGNVKSIASDLEQFFLENASIQSPTGPEESQIVPRLLDELRKTFPFHSKYVEQHATPLGVITALGEIVEWYKPENVQRLIRIYSFPLEGLASVKRRVLTRAVEMGLDLPADLPGEAVSLGLADDDTALVSHSLRAFLGLVRGDHDLEDHQVADNWQKLVEAAMKRDVPVDVEVAEVAVDYIRPRGADVSFAAEVAVLDSTPVAELDSEVLLRWLYRPTRRAEAALELMRREDSGSLPKIYEAVRLMGPDDLLEVVPRILADTDDEGESFFMDGLKSGRRELRVASALALGRLGLRSAVVPLINALCEHDEPDWKIESIVLSRFGVAAMRTVEQFLRNPRGCEERLVFLASALALGRCEKQVKELTDERDQGVSMLATRAMSEKGRVKTESEALLGADTDDPLLIFVRTMDSRLSGD
jgi:hypothetical protein